MDATTRQARAAVAALFMTNGAIFANLAPRLPEFKDLLGLGPAAYGLLVTAWPVGAILAGLAAGALIRRFGSAAVAVVGTLLTGLAVMGAGASGTLVAVAVAFAVGGAMDSITDVAQNAHGLQVQRRYGRSILNSFHAVWSIGAVLGGAMAAGAMALGIPLLWHFVISSALFAAVALTAWRFALPRGGRPQEVPAQREAAKAAAAPLGSRSVLIMTALVLIALAGAVVEDAGNSWATLYLTDSLAAPAALAATGYIVLVAAQFIGRILGDRMVDRWGQRLVAQLGASVLTLGMVLALSIPTLGTTLVGFAAAGFGVATLVPAAMEHADRLPGLAPGTGLSVVSWLMRLGFLISPPMIGLIAEHASLRTGLLVLPAAGLLVLLCSPVLGRRQSALSAR